MKQLSDQDVNNVTGGITWAQVGLAILVYDAVTDFATGYAEGLNAGLEAGSK